MMTQQNSFVESAKKLPCNICGVAALRTRRRRFSQDEDGAMIIFGVFIFTLMLAIGGLSFDLMRFEMHRERLQSTLERAVLAAASLTQTQDPQTVVEQYFSKAGMFEYLDSVVVTEGIRVLPSY